MRVGIVILPEDPWPIAAEKWRAAEDLGFAHAWTYDHLAWRDLRDGPWFSAIPTLTAAALTTSSIRIGTLVASPNFRHPVSFARELITLDDMSAGRLTLGIGAGGEGWDATILGQEPWTVRERGERFIEFVDLLDVLLREPEVRHVGQYYSANNARTHPGCVQSPRIPFAVAASGPKGMRLAARHASTWVTTGERGQSEPMSAADGSAAVARQMAALDEACIAEGRDPSTIDRLVLTGLELDAGMQSREAFNEVKAAYAEVGVTDLVTHWPRESEPYKAENAVLKRLDLS